MKFYIGKKQYAKIPSFTCIKQKFVSTIGCLVEAMESF